MKRIAPIVVLLAVASIGTGITLFVNAAANLAAQSQFDLVANDASDRLERRIGQHLLLIKAAVAHAQTSPEPLDRAQFTEFINVLNISGDYPGVRGIGFALLTDAKNDAAASALIASNYGIERAIWPPEGGSTRTPIVLLEPQDKGNQTALGFDMYSDATRRAAMDAALASGRPVATPPVTLIQEINSIKQIGFLVYAPVKVTGANSVQLQPNKPDTLGFIYSPFRAGDLHAAAWANLSLPAVFQTVDVQAGGALLTQSENFDALSTKSSFKADRLINVAGRQWRIRFASTSAFAGDNWQIGTLLLGAVSMLFAAALATSTRAQLQSLENAQKLASLSQQSAADKDMMLQEMKHRIKNSIARVLAIARQTASGSANIEEFKNSFFSRLQSMSTAQELLTRSHWENADLYDLLSGELNQILGQSWAKDRVSGEAIELNARATQALGLVFHELATNALKYGNTEQIEAGLEVHWRSEIVEGKPVLALEWHEPGSVAFIDQKPGFGSKLIAMNVERELGGTIHRMVGEKGLTIRIEIPKASIV